MALRQASSILLDQNYWIRLARAAHGKPDATEADHRAFDLADSLSSSGAVWFPLTEENYAEVRATGNVGRRQRLASAMLRLSRFRTFQSLRQIQIWELRSFAHSMSCISAPPPQIRFFGHGRDFAYGDSLFQFPEPWRLGLNLAQYNYLRGADRSEDHKTVLDAKRARFAQKELAIGKKFGEQGLRRERLRSAVALDTVSLHAEFLEDVLQSCGSSLAEFDHSDISAVIAGMPTLRVLSDLRYHAFTDQTNPLKANDYFDVRLLQKALPYVDAVATDSRWASTVRNRKVDATAVVIGSIEELGDHLESLASKD